MRVNLRLGLEGPDLVGLFRRAQEALLPDAGPPDSLFAKGRERKVTPGWLEKWAAASEDFIRASWEDRARLRLDTGRLVKITLEDYELEPRRLLDALAELPFEVCSAATLYPEWQTGALGEEYYAPSFGDMHWPHGWGCLFRGAAGHARLVSRRWLEYGPWRLLRGANDTSLVQFHDLAADSAAALAQARAGHDRMGISAEGGFIQSGFNYSQDLRGIYYASERSLHVAVPFGEAVAQRAMLDYCAARLYQPLGPEQPIENVVYVFVDEEAARAHLRELWLRGLECRAFVKGVETRLDDDYRPTPERPDWVLRLEGREGGEAS